MGKLGIVITDGVGFRNYILSDFLRQAELKFKEVTIYSCLPASVYDGFLTTAKVIELDVYPDTFFTWFFMKYKEIAHLELHRKGNFGIEDSYRINRSKSKTIRGVFKRFIFASSKYFKSEAWIQRFNFLQQQTFRNNTITKGYLKLLKEDQPDLLYFTHQRPPYIAPLIYAAERLGIKTGTFIFSWDNLASKGRMAGNFELYFVWSDLMKEELLEFYTTTQSENIYVVGTPQFEPYVLDRYSRSKQLFVDKFKLKEGYKTICFSCGDVSTSKNDPVYIETIAKAIHQGVFGIVNFLVRTSPAETPERFLFLKERYPFIVWNYPDWTLVRQSHQESWSQRVPNVEDMIDLRSILEYADVFVNMCSTMSLDAMCFEKPVINPVFGNLENGLYDDQRFLKYAHYKRVVESGAVAIAKFPEELIAEIKLALKKPNVRLEAQQKLIKLQVGHELEHTSKDLIKTIYNVCK